MVISLVARGLTTGEGHAHLTEITNRGVGDVLSVVGGGLKGLPDAIGEGWPRAVPQTCLVHLLPNSFR